MKITYRSLLFTAGIAAAFALNSARGMPEIGKPAPDFLLTDAAGRPHQLADYRGKIVVLEWVNPGCPFVKKHYESGNLPATQAAAVEQGVVWLAINSGLAGLPSEKERIQIESWAAEHQASHSAYLRDPGGDVARLFGAKTTPHLYVIKPDGTLAYNGAIDSIASAKQADIAKATNYVNAALAAIWAGRPVETAVSKPYGCGVKVSKRDT